MDGRSVLALLVLLDKLHAMSSRGLTKELCYGKLGNPCISVKLPSRTISLLDHVI